MEPEAAAKPDQPSHRLMANNPLPVPAERTFFTLADTGDNLGGPAAL